MQFRDKSWSPLFWLSSVALLLASGLFCLGCGGTTFLDLEKKNNVINGPDGPNGEKLSTSVDTFAQPSHGTTQKPVDVVFIVDTSGSLYWERLTLANNVDKLLLELEQQNLNDYRVAVMAAHSRSVFAGKPLADNKRSKVLYKELFDGSLAQTDACRIENTGQNPFSQLKCEFRANLLHADQDSPHYIREVSVPRAPKFNLPDNPFRLIDDGGIERHYGDPESADSARPMGEFGLRSLEAAISDRLALNQNLQGPVYELEWRNSMEDPFGDPGGQVAVYVPTADVDQNILRPEASWNFIFMSDENDICVKESFLKTELHPQGKWYNTTWDPNAASGHWVEAYGNRDFCQSSFDGQRITPEKVVSQLQSVRGGQPFSVHTFGYFELPGYTPPQDTTNTQESHSIGYWEATDMLGGKLIDLGNTAQYSQALGNIGQYIAADTQLVRTFCLTHEPFDPAQLSCQVDGVVMPNYIFNHNATACPETSHHAAVFLPQPGQFESQIECIYQFLP